MVLDKIATFSLDVRKIKILMMMMIISMTTITTIIVIIIMVRYFSSDYLSLFSFFTTRGISSPYLNGVILFHFFFMICIDQMF